MSDSRKKEVKVMLRALWNDEDGVTTVEYALLLALVVVAAIAMWSALGTKVGDVVDSVDSQMTPYT